MIKLAKKKIKKLNLFILELENVVWETNQHLNDISIIVYQDDIFDEHKRSIDVNTFKSSERGLVRQIFKKKKYCVCFFVVLLIIILAATLIPIFLV